MDAILNDSDSVSQIPILLARITRRELRIRELEDELSRLAAVLSEEDWDIVKKLLDRKYHDG